MTWQSSAGLDAQVNAFWQTSGAVFLGVIDNSNLQGVWVSTDGGANFSKITSIGSKTFSLQEYGGFVYVGGETNHKLSTDGSYVGFVDWHNSRGYPPYVYGMTSFGGDLILASNSDKPQGEGVYKVLSDTSLQTLVSVGTFPAITSSSTAIVAAVITAPEANHSYIIEGDDTSLGATHPAIMSGVPIRSLTHGVVFVGAGQDLDTRSQNWGLWYSSDGVNWSRGNVTNFSNSVSYGGGVYLAGVKGGIYKSYDGVNWTTCNSSCPPPLSVTTEVSFWGAYNSATNSYPLIMKVNASGGTGTYSYIWSNGADSQFMSMNVIAGQTAGGSVTVASGNLSSTSGWSAQAPSPPNGFPKHPLILIHGIGGRPEDWVRNGMVDYLSTLGYSTGVIKPFDYGSIGGIYDYQGDISVIGERLPDLINEYSVKSLDMGGDGMVDVLGFSMGGVVGRQGLIASPSASAKVRKFITVGSPNLGSYLASFFGYNDFNPKDNPVSGILGFMKNELLSKVLQLFKSGEQPLSINSPAAQQLMVGSKFLEDLNSQSLPTTLRTYAIYGNEKISLHQKIFFMDLKAELPLGDLVVDPSSASTIPGGTGALSFLYQESPQIDVHLLRDAFAAEYNFVGDPRGMKYYHSNLLSQDDVRQQILEVLDSP